MTRTGLAGPFRLSFDEIDALVTRTSAGVYALGHADADGRFRVNHVGRSDSNLKQQLLETIGSANLFKYAYFSSARTAFEKECELFHDIGPPGNRVHPGRPRGTGWECPRCRIFG
jgi:hypothetical protein